MTSFPTDSAGRHGPDGASWNHVAIRVRDTARIASMIVGAAALGFCLEAVSVHDAERLTVGEVIVCVAACAYWLLRRAPREDAVRTTTATSRQSTVHTMFVQLVSTWLNEHTVPECAMDAVTPRLAGVFGRTPMDFSFDAFRGSGTEGDWAESVITFPDDGSACGFEFSLYLQTPWSVAFEEQVVAMVRNGGSASRSFCCIPATMQSLQDALSHTLETEEVLGFDYRPQAGSRRWIYVSVDPASSTYRCCGVYDRDGLILIATVSGLEVSALRDALVVLMNSDGVMRRVKKDSAEGRPIVV